MSVPSRSVLRRLGITPSARYVRYLDGKEWSSVDGRKLDVPTYAEPIAVWFTRAPDDRDTDAPVGEDGWVPLAALGLEEPTFLAVKANADPCPVGLWERGARGFMPVAASLDEFLASFQPARAPRVLERLVEAANRIDGLLEGRRTKAKRKELEAAVEAIAALTQPDVIPSERALGSHPHARVPSRALFMQVKGLEALGKLREACALLDAARIDGAPVSIAPELHCRMLLELGEDERVLALCREGEPSALQQALYGRALLRAGDFAAAVAVLRGVVARQVDAALKLSPKKDRAAERAKRVAALRDELEKDPKTKATAGRVVAAL